MFDALKQWWNKPGDEVATAMKDAFHAGRMAERNECAALCSRHAAAHEQASKTAPTAEWREVSVNQALGASACAAAIKSRSNA